MRDLVRWFLLLALAWTAVPAQALAQEDSSRGQRRKAFLEGTEAFRRILFNEQFTSLNDLDALDKNPASTLLILLGDLSLLPPNVEEFVNAGGAVLLASDRSVKDRDIRKRLIALAGVSISGETLVCPEPTLCYMGKDYCPLVQPFPNTTLRLLLDAEAHTPLHVATNVPAKLYQRSVRFPGTIQRLARLPPSYLVTANGRRLMPHDPSPLFAVAGDVGDGRVLVMADHSVFINEMMLPEDNGNVEFTTNVVAWLGETGHQGQKRDRVLFVEDGIIKTQLEIPLKSIAIPPEEALRLLFARRNEILGGAGRLLAGLEDGGIDEKTVNALSRAGVPPTRLARWALTLATLLAGCFAVYRLGHYKRFRHDPTAPVLAGSIDRQLPITVLVEQRYRALLQAGNLAEPAMNLARGWFARFGVLAWAGPMPRVEIVGGWWKRRRLLARLSQAWRLAVGQGPRVAARELRAVEQNLAVLQAAHERGEWRLSAGLIGSPGQGRADG